MGGAREQAEEECSGREEQRAGGAESGSDDQPQDPGETSRPGGGPGDQDETLASILS